MSKDLSGHKFVVLASVVKGQPPISLEWNNEYLWKKLRQKTNEGMCPCRDLAIRIRRVYCLSRMWNTATTALAASLTTTVMPYARSVCYLCSDVLSYLYLSLIHI